MKLTLKYACGHFGPLYAAGTPSVLETRRLAARLCPQCAAAAAAPKRKPRRVKDDDLASDIFGQP